MFFTDGTSVGLGGLQAPGGIEGAHCPRLGCLNLPWGGHLSVSQRRQDSQTMEEWYMFCTLYF